MERSCKYKDNNNRNNSNNSDNDQDNITGNDSSSNKRVT